MLRVMDKKHFPTGDGEMDFEGLKSFMRKAKAIGQEEYVEIITLDTVGQILESYEERKGAIEQVRLALKAYDEVKSGS